MKKSSRLCSHQINHGEASDGICNLKGEGHIALLDKRGLSEISMLSLFAMEKPIKKKILFFVCAKERIGSVSLLLHARFIVAGLSSQMLDPLARNHSSRNWTLPTCGEE
jgi:hypothetical protein